MTPADDPASRLGKAALAYARKGWAVFPCEARGKKPLCEHGLKDATTDEGVIRGWWARWPEANIGHPTGARIVLDVDGVDGEAALAALEDEYEPLPLAPAVQTGKGRHLYFAPNGAVIRNSAGRLGPHLDVRGDGGYVILPPSIHPNGARYEWLTRMKPALIPAWVGELLSGPEPQRAWPSSATKKIAEGQRNAHLASLAGSMRRRGMAPAAIDVALLQENRERCYPPLPDAEVRRIAQSVARYEPASKPTGEIVSLAKVTAFSSISPKPLRWLWPGRIPFGKLTLLEGDPGLGKSLLILDIAARVSTGAGFPDGAGCEQGDVIILSAEDDAEDTIRPRLDAAGADVTRVHWFEAVRNVTADGKSVERPFNLESDIGTLEDTIRQTGARVVEIDPITAYLGGTDSHKNAEVRGLLAPLAALAAKYKVAVIAVNHLRKNPGAAIHRGMGSLAFAAAPRAVWGVVADPDDKDRRLLLSVKQNLAPAAGGLAYRIEAPNGTERIAWEPGAVAADVNTMMGGFESREDHTERREAEEWLRDLLADGPRAATDVKNQSRSVGLTWITVRRAAASLGVRKQKIGGRGAGWEWSLPGEVKDAHPRHSEVSSFDQAAENAGDTGQSKVKDAHPSMPEHLCPVSTFEEGQI